MNDKVTRRKAIGFALALGTAAVLAEVVRPRRRDDARPRLALDAVFPPRFGEWRLDTTVQSFVQPPDEQGKVYGIYDQVLQRAYLDSGARRVMLCVAYGGEQSPALEVHRPEVCYAASGFRVSEIHKAWLNMGTQKLPVTRLHAAMRGRSEPITYWTVLGDRVMADSLDARWSQLLAGLQGELRDGMLVRVSSIDRDTAASYRLHERFVNDLIAAVPSAHRSRVFGSFAAA